MVRVLRAGLMLSVLATAAFANIANPDLPGKNKSLDTTLSIRLDRNAREAKLIIPRNQVRQLRAELEQLENGSDDSASAGTVTDLQTIVSGGLLSLAFLFGGLWFFRSGRTSRAGTVTAASFLIAIASAATIVYANAGPPPAASSITGKMFSSSVHIYKQGSGKIKLEVSDKARIPELIVPDPEEKPGE